MGRSAAREDGLGSTCPALRPSISPGRSLRTGPGGVFEEDVGRSRRSSQRVRLLEAVSLRCNPPTHFRLFRDRRREGGFGPLFGVAVGLRGAKAPLIPGPHFRGRRTSCVDQLRVGAEWLPRNSPYARVVLPRGRTCRGRDAPAPSNLDEFSFRLASCGNALCFRRASRFLAELSPPIRTLLPWISSWQCSRASTDAGRP